MSESSGYSQDATVAAITSFYEIVKLAHADTYNELVYPPPGGWPDITHELFRKTGRNSTVIELLRHLPYFTDDAAPCIMEQTNTINYIDHNYLNNLRSVPEKESSDNENSSGDEIGPHMVHLTTCRRDGYYIVLDTKRGAAIWWSRNLDWPGDMQWGDLPCTNKDHDQKAPDAWKCMPTYKIETFFNMCCQKYIDMEWLPELGEIGMGEVYGADGEPGEERKQIMRNCGWPSRTWDKERAAREMTERADDLL